MKGSQAKRKGKGNGKAPLFTDVLRNHKDKFVLKREGMLSGAGVAGTVRQVHEDSKSVQFPEGRAVELSSRLSMAHAGFLSALSSISRLRKGLKFRSSRGLMRSILKFWVIWYMVKPMINPGARFE